MAKTIKFNLILDNYPVRNLEDLQEHFSIEDMLKYYKNGLLLRWLDVRGYKKQYEAVKVIADELNRKEIIVELVKIFEIEIELSDIEKGICILDYLDEEKELNIIYKENAFLKKQIIDDYHSGYEALIGHIEANSQNMAVLKADIIELEREYFGLFQLNYFELYYRFLNNAPKAIFAILTRDVFRKYWIQSEGSPNDTYQIYNSIKKELLSSSDIYTSYSPALYYLYSKEKEVHSFDKLKEILGNDLKIVKRNTQAMWDPIERPEVKIMVLNIQSGTFIKNAGEFSEKLSATDVNEKFLKFNGLEYQCNNESYELLYMEV